MQPINLRMRHFISYCRQKNFFLKNAEIKLRHKEGKVMQGECSEYSVLTCTVANLLSVQENNLNRNQPVSHIISLSSAKEKNKTNSWHVSGFR